MFYCFFVYLIVSACNIIFFEIAQQIVSDPCSIYFVYNFRPNFMSLEEQQKKEKENARMRLEWDVIFSFNWTKFFFAFLVIL